MAVWELEQLLPGAGARTSNCCRERCGPCGICCAVTSGLILTFFVVLSIHELTIGPSFHDVAYLNQFRPASALEAERARREAAAGSGLITLDTMDSDEHIAAVAQAVAQNKGTGLTFPLFNFVQGFRLPGFLNGLAWDLSAMFGQNSPRWKPPIKGETVGVMTYQEFAKEHFGDNFPDDTVFKEYYTGGRVPSWEDNENHVAGVETLGAFVNSARALGHEPTLGLREMEPRVAFDNEALAKVAWNGFNYMGPTDIAYASNGIYGVALLEQLMEKYNTSGEVLGILMTDSVFSAHLRRDPQSGLLGIDLASLEGYKPIPGFTSLGGSASFREEGGVLRTVKLAYGGETYTDFDVPKVAEDYKNSKRTGWRYAEGAIIVSLLAMTNLVMHVKDLHLELAAVFQAVSVDAFANEPEHPVRRLVDPFIHRSVQATNDNFRLLFDYHAAEFSLAPLTASEQLKLIGDSMKHQPLNLAEMDMEFYGKVRHIDASASTAGAITNSSKWGWRWHYRALTVQRLYDELVDCWLTASFGRGPRLDDYLAKDLTLQAWWRSMIDHLPSLKRATKQSPDWAPSGPLTAATLKRFLRTLMVWVSWIHEDVGHSAAAYVYNPVYTPMCMPEDGLGVPLASWVFNAEAYRGFVFLHRSALLEEPPNFWFAGNRDARQCFKDFQSALRELGETDPAFSECDKTGFYSCVGRVETAVSS